MPHLIEQCQWLTSPIRYVAKNRVLLVYYSLCLILCVSTEIYLFGDPFSVLPVFVCLTFMFFYFVCLTKHNCMFVCLTIIFLLKSCLYLDGLVCVNQFVVAPSFLFRLSLRNSLQNYLTKQIYICSRASQKSLIVVFRCLTKLIF